MFKLPNSVLGVLCAKYGTKSGFSNTTDRYLLHEASLIFFITTLHSGFGPSGGFKVCSRTAAVYKSKV